MVEPDRIKKILLIQKRAIGDVVLTTAVFPVLRRHFPQAELHFLTGSGIGPLLQPAPELDRVLEYPYPSSYLPGVFHFLPTIRREKYDLVVDFQATPGTASLTYFSGAPLRLGWANNSRKFAYNLTSRANEVDEYVAVQKCKMLRAVGIEEVNDRIRLKISAAALEKAQKMIGNPRDAGRLLVNISVKGKRQARHWFPDRYARLTDLLAERYRAKVFYNRAPGEKEYVENVAALCRHRPEILPECSLETFAAILAGMDLHISYDNGPKHMAVAVETPTICFYGSANPLHWHPPGRPEHIAILPDVPCRLCGKRNCGLMICMEEITPEQVCDLLSEIPSIQKKIQSGR